MDAYDKKQLVVTKREIKEAGRDPEKLLILMERLERMLLKLKMKHQALNLRLNLLDKEKYDDASSVSSYKSFQTVDS